MPPKRGKATPAGGAGGGGGRGGGAGAGRGGSTRGGAGRGAGVGAGAATPAAPPSHVGTVGVRRPGYGKAGRATTVVVNHFVCTIPTGAIYHYDEIGGDRALPARANVETMKRLQEHIAPDVFTPRGVYDGRKNLFTTKKLALGDNDTRTFELPLGNPNPNNDRPPRTRRIKIQLANRINPEVLSQFQQGRHAQDNEVSTALMSLNVALRHGPIQKYTFNTRSFFLPTGKKPVALGLELWPGVFQSIRPAVNSMHINIDTSTGVVYKPGPVIQHALAALSRSQVADLSLAGGRLNPRDLRSLQSRLKGLRITLTYLGNNRPEKSIQGLTNTGASNTMFDHNGQMISVAQYFQTTFHRTVQYPNIPCVKISSRAIIPMEFCEILPGQLMRKAIPQELTDQMVEFSRKRPEERLKAIKDSLESLDYKSDNVAQFGITVQSQPVECPARILEPPSVLYNRPVKPRNGAWNLRNERLKAPAQIKGWILVIFERQGRFGQDVARQTIEGLKRACEEKGITGLDMNPLIEWAPAQGDIGKILLDLGGRFKQHRGALPNLVVAIMPQVSGELYPAVKRFGDVTAGVATQCLKASKCFKSSPQYYGNVCLKINVKLGGTNAVLAPEATGKFLGDPANPTLILGADTAHPAPGTEGRPSFTALVGSVDSMGSKYVAAHRAQTSRRESITDLKDMAKQVIKLYQGYQKGVEKKANPGPKRILFYRDGVSEGQFKEVLKVELEALKIACEELELKPMPKITFVVVGKRHHTRMFPKDPKQTSDKSGNCDAGTVIDSIIGHPLEFDFFLLSHGGLIGTSRPAHYNVLHDDNGFTPDALQGLTYSLCHIYARATRSVSIPPPVYYADIVCGRAKHHLPPSADYDLSDSMTVASGTDAESMLERIRAAYKPTHATIEKSMYFQ